MLKISKGTTKIIIAITKNGATLANNTEKFNISFDQMSLKLAVNDLPDQRFFNVGSFNILTNHRHSTDV